MEKFSLKLYNLEIHLIFLSIEFYLRIYGHYFIDKLKIQLVQRENTINYYMLYNCMR